MKQRFYQLETPVEGSEPLVQMANQILRQVDMLRTISAPSSTSRYKLIT